MPTKTSRSKTVVPLYCHKCKSHDLKVQSGQTRAHYKGKKRTRVNVTCKSCGNEWESFHQEALDLGKLGDAIREEHQPTPDI